VTAHGRNWKEEQMLRRAFALGIILGSTLILAACTQVVPLVIDPVSAIVEPGGSVTFTAKNYAGNPIPVTWSVTSGPGTITAAGVYTAPTTVTEVTNATVTATRVGYPTITGSATVTIKPPLTAGLIDPIEDTFGSGSYDIWHIKTSRTSTTLTVIITFSPTMTHVPSIPPPGQLVGSGDLAGFITLDIDENSATGIPSANSFYCPSLPLSASGVDLFISLFYRNAAGNYMIYDTTDFLPVGEATPTLTLGDLTLSIPLTNLGGDDGRAYLSSVLGNDAEPTDCIPDEGAAVVTGKAIEPENPYREFLLDLGITGPGWTQTPSLETQTPSFTL
jgi:hypothetical protein